MHQEYRVRVGYIQNFGRSAHSLDIKIQKQTHTYNENIRQFLRRIKNVQYANIHISRKKGTNE